MRAVALVAARELRSHAPAGLAALVTALLPWVAPWLPGVARGPVAEVREATALALAALLGFALAAYTGTGLVSRDLGEGRIGFFLALPLRAGALWAGRLLAAVVLVYGGILLVILPAALAAGELTLRRNAVSGHAELPLLGETVWVGVVLLAAAPLLLILLVHQLATALRDRSPWLLADLGVLALAGAWIGGTLARLVAAAAVVEMEVAFLAAMALVLATLIAGGVIGLRRGGVLLARVHRAQTLAVAAGLLVIALLLAGAVQWVLAVDARDLRAAAEVSAAPAGRWFIVTGPLQRRPSYAPWLLVDGEGGSSLPLSPAFPDRGVPPPVFFAADGRSAVWLRPTGPRYDAPSELVWIDLDSPPRLRPATAEAVRPWMAVALPAGERVALAESRRITLWDQRGDRLLMAADLPPAHVEWQQLRFLAAGTLRLARLVSGDGGARLQSWDLDPATRRLHALADRALMPHDQPAISLSPEGDRGLAYRPAAVSLSPDGDRLLVSRGWAGRGGIALLDGRTGEDLAQPSPPTPDIFATARFLADGRVVVAVGRQGRLDLRVFDRDGTLQREMPAGAGRWARLGGEWRPGGLVFTAVVVVPRSGGNEWRHELQEVDLSTGDVRSVAEGLAPVGAASPWFAAAADSLPGAPTSRLFLREATRSLVRLAPGGSPTVVLPR